MAERFLGLFFGMAALCVLAVGCNDEKTGDESEAAVEESQPEFHGDPAYIARICNDVNNQMMVSSLRLDDENKEVFDGMWLEDDTVILSIQAHKTRLDYVTKGIMTILLPKQGGKTLHNLLERLNKRKYVLPTNFFVAVKQNNYKMKFRYWNESGEKLDIPLAYEDMPEPYKKPQNPLAKKIDDYAAVTIGNQVWMAENLDRDIEGSVCYDHNPENCEEFGRLYDFKTAIKACPAGWHLPDSSEMEDLFITADKMLTEEIAKNHELDSIIQLQYIIQQGHWEGDSMVTEDVHAMGRVLLASGKDDVVKGLGYLGFNMKAAGRAEYSYSSSGENESITNERFSKLNNDACLWTSVSEKEDVPFWERHLYVEFVWHQYKRSGFYTKCSVRCVKDQETAKE